MFVQGFPGRFLISLHTVHGGETTGGALAPEYSLRVRMDICGGVRIDTLQHIDQIHIGIQPLEFAGDDKTVENSCRAGTELEPTEKPVFPSHRDRPLARCRCRISVYSDSVLITLTCLDM